MSIGEPRRQSAALLSYIIVRRPFFVHPASADSCKKAGAALPSVFLGPARVRWGAGVAPAAPWGKGAQQAPRPFARALRRRAVASGRGLGRRAAEQRMIITQRRDPVASGRLPL